MCHSGSVSIALIWEMHFAGAPWLSGNLLKTTGWAAWFDAEDSEVSTLVSAKKCNRGNISAPVFRGEIIPAPKLVCFGEVFSNVSF